MSDMNAETNAPPALSVVVPVYNEAEVLPAFHTELAGVLDGMDIAYEVVYVDDGSTDGTDRIIESFGGNARGVVLSRNFGHQAALLAGLNDARGTHVLMMDGDLQHPPSLIPELWRLARDGNEIVQALRANKNTGWFKRLTAGAFYRIFNLLTDVKLDFNAADFRLVSRRVCDAVTALDERDLFLRGMFPWLGFKTAAVPYEPATRGAGTSKYGLRKMMALSLSGLTAFSTVPIRLSLILCGVSLAVALGYSGYAAWVRLTLGKGADSGWASLIVLNSFFFSGVFMVLAVLGDYVGRIHFETKKRPPYVVGRVIGR